MPRTRPHPPVYYTDARGTRWRVFGKTPADAYDVFGAPAGPDVRWRLFLREGDRWRFLIMLREGDDPCDLSPATLEAQLDRALRGMPMPHPWENPDHYVRRQYAHIAAHPDFFPPGYWRRVRG